MKKLLFLFCAVLLLNASYAQKTEVYQDTIPFRNDLGLIIIPITFNGVEKQFAFDTGAEYSVAYGWAKEDLKKTNKTMTIHSSSGRKSRMRFYSSGLIELGSRKIRKHRILNAPKNEIFSCHKVDGILGVDIIKALNWTIDYKNKILIMYPANYFPKKVKKMYPLDFDFRNQRPYVYLALKKNRLRFLLDTGAGGTSNISKRNYNLTDLDKYKQITFYSGSFDVNGILTSSKPTVFQLPKKTSKKVQLSPIVYYDNLKSTKIGNSLWKDQELFLSLKNKRLYLASSEINESYSSYSCSVMFIKGKMRIVRIQEGSDVWNLGVRQGDEVLSFNGKQFSDFCSMDQYRRAVINSGKSFTIQLTSGKTVTISKKPLLD
ncbi:aspartyl protease family protein [Pseudotenacibaculum haliotis]|uniref:Aspartyl protease family protein n=1 Tax=Pseudotenacibaculum haliotis TaxID=1862138 RepID=A0ABW5LPR7_9FLAO